MRSLRLDFSYFVIFASFFENTDSKVSLSLSRTIDCVIPAWSAGIQADMDVSGRILRT